MSVHLIYLTCLGVIALMLVALLCVAAAWLIDGNHPAGRHEAPHVIPEYDAEPGDEWADELHDIADDTLGRMTMTFHAAPVDVPSPAPATLPPGAVTTAGLGTSTLQPLPDGVLTYVGKPMTPELAARIFTPRINAATPLWHAGENERCGNWPMTDRSDFTDTGWSRLDEVKLKVALAREQLDAGFDHIVDYATSGIPPRWEGAA